MKLTCNQETLSKALNTVLKAVTVRTTIPILKGILLQTVGDNKLKLSSSDLDFSIETTIDANIESSGSIIVNAKLFNDIIKKLSNDIITIEITDNMLVSIKTLNSKFTVISQNPEEFPNIPGIEDFKSELSFDRVLLKDMIRQTQFCASIDDTKGVIVGILMELTPDKFNMVAIDGYRMAVRRENVTNKESKKIIISARILNEVSKIISEDQGKEDIRILLSDKNAIMLLEDTKVVMRLLEGEFISYEDVLPKDHKTNVIIDRISMINSIERASLLSREGKNNLIRVEVKENLMIITSNSEEGNVREDIIMEKTGEDIEIGFNSKYLLDALKAVEDEDIRMEFSSSIKPCLVKPLTGDRYEYLILPVRIS